MKNFRKLIFTGGFVLAILIVNGLGAVGYDYDYYYKNCYDNSSGTWTSVTVCENAGTDCSRYIPNPCSGPNEQ